MKVQVKPVAQFNKRETELIVRALRSYAQNCACASAPSDGEEAEVLATSITKSFDDAAGALNAMAHNMRKGNTKAAAPKEVAPWDKE